MNGNNLRGLAAAMCLALTTALCAQAQNESAFTLRNSSGVYYETSLANALTQMGTNPGSITLPANVTSTITSSINLYSGQELVGCPGSTIQASSSMNTSDMIEIQGAGVKIRNLTLDRNVTNATALGNGIDLNGNAGVTVDGVAFFKQGDGVASSNTSVGASNITIKNCFFLYMLDDGIKILNGSTSGCTGITIQDSAIQLAGTFGIAVESTSLIGPASGVTLNQITNVSISGVVAAGIIFDGKSWLIDKVTISGTGGVGITFNGNYNNCQWIKISNSSISGCGNIVTAPTSGNPITSWTFNRTSFVSPASNFDAGILFYSNVDQVEISDNTIFYNGGDGIWGFNGLGYSNNVKIVNNIIHSNGKYSGAAITFRAGIFLEDGIFGNPAAYNDWQIIGNRSYNDSSLSGQVQLYGLLVDQSTPVVQTNRLIISNNNFYDPSHTASILLAGGSSIINTNNQ